MATSASFVERISVCQTLRPISASVPLSQQHTHPHTSVQTVSLLISGGKKKHLSTSTNYSSGYISPSTHRKTNDIDRYTHTLTSRDDDVSWLSSVMRRKELLLLRSNVNDNTYLPAPPQVLYNPVKVYGTDLRRTGSSFKNNWSNCFSR